MRRRLAATFVVLASLVMASPVSGGAADAESPPRVPILPSNVDVDYQLGGGSAPAKRVGVVTRDRKESPVPGRFSICYVNAFQTQPGEKRLWRRHPDLVLRRAGRPVSDPLWPQEWILDLRTPATRRALAAMMDRWIAGCARKGFDAVEFDNLDTWTRFGPELRRSHAIAYARLLVRSAHRHGLAAGQKNWVEWNGRSVGFDFAVAESCGRWRECRGYSAHYGTRWFAVEYRRADFNRACRAVGSQVAVVLRDRALSPRGIRAWC